MKIVQIIGSLEGEAAGPSYSVPRLSRSLQEAGHDCRLMSVGEPGRSETMEVPHDRYRPRPAHPQRLANLCISPDMKRALRPLGRGADILHTHGLWRMINVYPSQVTGAAGAAVVVSPRGMLSEAALAYSRQSKRVFWALWQGKALHAAAMLHATSEQECEDARSAGLTQPVAILPNGIDLPTSSDTTAVPETRVKRVLFLGRIHPIKRLEALITAWAALGAATEGWELVLQGPGDADYLAALKTHAQAAGATRIEFRAPVFGDEKDRSLREAAITVLPSASENFGMVVAESLACGTPAIATRGAPWSGLAEHGCGWWIDHGAAPMQRALEEALSQPEGRLAAMGAAGRDWMRRSFSWDGIARDMASAYAWLRSGGERPSFVVI